MPYLMYGRVVLCLLCCVALSCVLLRCAGLCCVALCCVALSCVCCVSLRWAGLCCVALCRVLLRCVASGCVLLCCVPLRCIVSGCVVLCCVTSQLCCLQVISSISCSVNVDELNHRHSLVDNLHISTRLAKVGFITSRKDCSV